MSTEHSDNPEQHSDLIVFLESVLANLSDNSGEALQQLAQANEDLEQYSADENYEEAKIMLRGEAGFHHGTLCMTTGDIPAARQYFGAATKDFKTVELEGKAKVCDALETFCRGITELRQKNFATGLQLLQQVESKFGDPGTIDPSLRLLIDHTTPEHLFAAGIMALMARDLTRAQVLITDAANRTEALAKTYHQDDPATQSFVRGLAKFYRASFDAAKLSDDFSVFDLEELAHAEDLGHAAREARELISRGDLTNPIQQNIYRLTGTISAVLDTLPLAAKLVLAMLGNKPVPDIDYAGLSKRLKQAADEAAAGGEQNLEMVKTSQRLGLTIANLRRYAGERPVQQSHVRLFVMQPFGPESKIVEDALRAVFEDEPYWFQVILARDQTLAKNLFENVRRHMDLVDAFVADISDQNPNVMIELGMTENDPRERPVLVLRRSDSPQPPADLKARLYVEYDLPAVGVKDRVLDLAGQLRDKMEGIADLNSLLRHRHARFLSASYVRSELKR
ncbi:MAG TPA: hypothetical protein VHW72_05565, partial [Candidatus Angelobacter sp.]|nr:hypothetical protein [Candidatus Angelobacter sp.]